MPHNWLGVHSLSKEDSNKYVKDALKKNYGINWDFFPIPKTFVNWPSIFLSAKFTLRC